MIHTVSFSVMRAKRMIKNESARAVLVLLISFMLMSQVSFAGTDLISAAYDGNLSQVTSLVKKGADVNYTNNNGSTALLFAAQKGHIKIVKYLIEKGADVNHVNNDGFTALLFAAQDGHSEVVKWLIEKGAEVNRAAKDGSTPLLVAVEMGHQEIVKCLIDRGVDVNHATKGGATPLLVAASHGHIKIVKYLIEKGADVNHIANDGSTALLFATKYGYQEIVKYLMEKIAEVNHASNDGETSSSPITSHFLSSAISKNTDTIDHKINENIGHIVAAFDPEELPGSFNTGYMDVNESLFTYLDLVKEIKNNVGYFDYQALLNIPIGKHSEYKLQNLDTIVVEIEKQFHLGKKIYSTILGKIGHFVTLAINSEGKVTIIDSNNSTQPQLGKDERAALLQALNSQKIIISDATKPIEFRFNKDIRAQQQKADNDCLIYSMLNASQIAKEGNISGYKSVTSFLNSGKIGKYEDYKQIGNPDFSDNKSISNGTTKLVDDAKAKFLKSYRNEIKKRFLQLLPPDIQDKYGYKPELDYHK